ncbi:MAG: nuclear transport factor 2 family protein [Casimicrobiaceae bacterium]
MQRPEGVTSMVDADYIRALERSRLQALVERNMPLARQLHAPDFQLITPNGFAYSRDRYLGEIESGQLRYALWEPGEMQARVSAGMVLLRYKATLDVDSVGGRVSRLTCWHTDSYEINDGQWQVVWSQATAIRQPP